MFFRCAIFTSFMTGKVYRWTSRRGHRSKCSVRSEQGMVIWFHRARALLLNLLLGVQIYKVARKSSPVLPSSKPEHSLDRGEELIGELVHPVCKVRSDSFMVFGHS